MKKSVLLFLLAAGVSSAVFAQEEKKEEERRGFKKENLFTGGSISIGFSNIYFTIGGNPEFGYSVARWLDAGIIANYNYTSYRDYNGVPNDKLRQTIYGGGVFTRIYPVRFLFAQAQIEHNWIRYKYIPNAGGGNVSQTSQSSANSVLLGAGYTTGRDPLDKKPYGYLAVLFDVLKENNSPYTDYLNRTIPIVRAGFVVPLFQGRGR